MPSATSTPKGPRLSYDQALVVAAEKESAIEKQKTLIETVQAEIANLENVGGSVDVLEKELVELADALASERKKPTLDQDQDRLTRLEDGKDELEVDLFMAREEVRKLKKELEKLLKHVEELAGALEESEKVIKAELRLNGEIPPSILDANEEYEATVRARSDEIHSAKERFFIPGGEAFEREIKPVWKRLSGFLEKFAKAEAAARPALPLANFPVFAVAEIEAMAKAFELLPGQGDPAERVEKVRNVLKAYMEAREGLAMGKVSTHAGVMTLKNRVQALKEIEVLLGPENTEGAIEARHKAFLEEEKQIQQRHQAAITKAERALAAVISTPEDSDFLKKARVPEVAEISNALIEGLEDDASPEYVREKFAQSGIPVTAESFKQALEARKKLYTDKNEAVPTDHDLIEQVRDDVRYVFLSGRPITNQKQKEKIDKRLGELAKSGAAPSKPKPELVEVLCSGIALKKAPSAGWGTMDELIKGYFEAITKDRALADTDESLEKLMDDTFDPVIKGLEQLIRGKLQAEQKKMGVTDPALLRQERNYYRGLICKAEGIEVPDVEKLKAEAEQWVKSFEASMEITLVVEEGVRAQEKINQERTVAIDRAKGAVAEQELVQEEIAKRAKVKMDIKNYLDARGKDGDPEAKATERKTEKAKWAREHATKLKEATEKEEAARKAMDAAKKAVETKKQSRAYKGVAARVENVEQFLQRLTAKDYEAFATEDQEQMEFLKEAKDIQVGDKTYDGASLMQMVLAHKDQAPFAKSSEWVPPIVASLTVGQLHEGTDPPEFVIERAYEFAIRVSEPARTAAAWFAKNVNTNVERVLLGLFERKVVVARDNTWRQELHQQGEAVYQLLERMVNDLEEQIAEIDRNLNRARLHDPKEAALLGRKRDPLAKSLHRLRKQYDEMRSVGMVPLTAQTQQAFLQATFHGLRELTREFTGQEPDVSHAPEKGSVGISQSLSRIRRDPTVEQHLIERLHEVDRQFVEGLDKLPGIATALSTNTKVNLAGCRAELAAERRVVTGLEDAARIKETEHEVIDTVLQGVKSETLEGYLEKFDEATAQEIVTRLDPDALLGPDSDKRIAERVDLADKELKKAKEEFIKKLEATVNTYIEWLDAKDVLTRITGQSTESQKLAVEAMKKEVTEMLAVFASQGASEKDDKTKFTAWWKALQADAAKKKAFFNSLVPGIA